MNKYLLMSAAAVLASSTAATASVESKSHSGTQSVYATATISGSVVTFCDAVTLAWSNSLYEDIDAETGCGTGYTGVYGIGNGLAGKTKGVGSNVDVSDSIEATNAAQLNLDFQVSNKGPINGGNFGVWLTFVSSGSVYTEQLYAGHYYFGTPPKGAHHQQALSKIAMNKSHSAMKGISLK